MFDYILSLGGTVFVPIVMNIYYLYDFFETMLIMIDIVEEIS